MIPITATCVNRKVKSITLTNVPSFVARRDVEVQVPELGAVVVDIVYSGMWYCVVDTKRMIRASLPNFPLTPDNGKEICKYGEMIKVACREQYPVHHPLIEYTGCDILVFCSPGASETVTSGWSCSSVMRSQTLTVTHFALNFRFNVEKRCRYE